MSIELQPIREWQEKDGKKPLKSVRLYIGHLHVATVEPTKDDPDMYYSRSMLDVYISTAKPETLADIKMAIELSIKEFVVKVVKPRKLVRVEDYK